MRMSVFGVSMSLLIAAGASAGESRIARVVVYPDRAQVARVQTVACGAKAAAEFPQLPPAINLRSLRASAKGALVEGIDVQQRTRESAFAPQAAELDSQLRKLEAQSEEQRNRQQRARLAQRQAGGYDAVTAQMLSREMALPGPDLKAWTLALEGMLGARQAATKAELAAGIQLRELQRRQQELGEKRELLGASAQRRETYARVQLSCASGSAVVELTYVVGGASWTPFYEARADDAAGEGPLDLSMVATVSQRSGEDWTGARLVLSTAVPRQDATPPELVPLRLYAEPREPPKKVLVRRDEEQQHAQAGAMKDSETAAGTDISQQGLSVQLAVREPADVPGDGTATNVDVASTRLKAAFAWKVMPSQLPFVLRVADLVNAAPFPLLAGPVSLFRKGSFAGRTELARVAQGARFQLAFGLEENVKVKRLVLEELTKDTGLFSKGRRFKFAYAFEVTSYLGGAATIEVSDHVPVSELDDVQVSLGEKTTPGFTFDKEGGIVTWQAKVGPGEKQRLELHFAVDVPASYDSAGL